MSLRAEIEAAMRSLTLLLPALAPSWRFFPAVTPSPRIEFRALRAEMGLPANIRTPNAVPLFCQPAKPHWNLLEP